MKLPTVKRLVYPLGTRFIQRTTCSANVEEATARWRNFIGKGYKCERRALYIVNGHHFCKTHAGAYLIRVLQDGEHLVQRSARPDKPAPTNAKQQPK